MTPRKPDSTKPGRHRRRDHKFLAAWLRSPRKMGALIPSSRALARAMAAQVPGSKSGTVIELGAGTGVVTNALLAAGITHDHLVILEREPELHALIAAHFPTLKTVCADALHLDEVTAKLGIKNVSAIVSSLPLLSMPKEVKNAIIEKMAALIGKDGVIVQFTYGPRSPISQTTLKKNHLTGKKVKTILTNVPPAHVWVYRKN